MHAVTLSLADWVFMLFVFITLGCLATRRDALLLTALGLISVGTILKGSLIGGFQVAFNSIMAGSNNGFIEYYSCHFACCNVNKNHGRCGF